MTHKNERNVEIIVVLLDVVRVVFSRLPLVDVVEVEARIVVLDRFEEHFESLMETAPIQRSAI